MATNNDQATEDLGILDAFEEIKDGILGIELDIRKAIAGNNAAGVRARKQLRAAKGRISTIVKATTELAKAQKSSKGTVEGA